MNNIPSKKRLIAAGICAAILLFLSFFYESPLLSSQAKNSKLFEEASQLYKNKALNAAFALLENNYTDILSEDEGCELVISTFASLQKISPTLSASEKCMELDKGVGISHEAYAMATASVGEFEKGSTKLSEEVLKHPNARIHSALAQLYVYQKQDQKAHFHLLRAIEIGSPWSTWLARVSSSRSFYENKDFLTELVSLLETKKDVVSDAELKILSYLEKQGLTTEYNILTKRLKTVSPHSKSDG